VIGKDLVPKQLRIVEVDLTPEELRAVEDVRALFLLSSTAAAARLLIRMSLNIDDDGAPERCGNVSH
jgi:hypothetical protein